MRWGREVEGFDGLGGGKRSDEAQSADQLSAVMSLLHHDIICPTKGSSTKRQRAQPRPYSGAYCADPGHCVSAELQRSCVSARGFPPPPPTILLWKDNYAACNKKTPTPRSAPSSRFLKAHIAGWVWSGEWWRSLFERHILLHFHVSLQPRLCPLITKNISGLKNSS